MTVVPPYCAYFIRLKGRGGQRDEKAEEPLAEVHEREVGTLARVVGGFNRLFHQLLSFFEARVTRALDRPARSALLILGGIVLLVGGVFPFVGRAYFPRTDPGQFVINLKAPSGTRLEVTDKY